MEMRSHLLKNFLNYLQAQFTVEHFHQVAKKSDVSVFFSKDYQRVKEIYEVMASFLVHVKEKGELWLKKGGN